jgi:hypothetical protein
MGKQHSDGYEQFLRELIFAEEDRQLHTPEKWTSGFRWFRSPNVVCIEHYRLHQSQRANPRRNAVLSV